MKPLVLTDIEGTTSAISFVKDVLFPFARAALPDFVREHGQEPEVREWLDRAAVDGGGVCQDEMIVELLQGWIDEDRKHPALKALQGMIWREGYREGEFKAHVYPDAAQSLRAWHASGHTLAVYSSGSVPAQKLLFGHSTEGNLAPLFSAWFDTAVGGKREEQSYRNILQKLGVSSCDVVFLSDIVEELDAARDAGMRTVLLDRRADYPMPRMGHACHGHVRVESFADVAT